ncbi:MAG TPA: hypothetical protein VHA56_21410 [Mucilaginibacter sp.]|nr:hypothetical protein [Mucilaginibacter sp.]
MQIKITFVYIVAFMAFVFVFGQLHELAHLSVARLICGSPGKQTDFNLWTLCDGCEARENAYLATLAGPVFSFAMIWSGYFISRCAGRRYWPTAFVLIMGNLPFARIFTAAIGKGDETTVLKTLLNGEPSWLIKSISFFIVAALSIPPLTMILKCMDNRRKLLTLAAFCIGPLLIMMLYEFILLGKVLKAGFLVGQHFLGVADFIYLHTLLMVLVVLIFRKSLFNAYPKVIT